MQAQVTLRLKYLIFSFVVFLLCVLIVIFFSDSPIIRGFVGDILIIFLMYFSLKVLFPKKDKSLMFGVWIFAIGVEILQYFNLVDLLGLSSNRLAVIIIGSTFDILDILAYTLGAAILLLHKYISDFKSYQQKSL